MKRKLWQVHPNAGDGEKLYCGLTIDTMARTIWGEARGEGVAGMRAVACVIINRYEISLEKGGFWWGDDIIQICQKPYQFSCWNRSDPNFRKVISVDNQDKVFVSAMQTARKTIDGELPDITSGATHYHAKGITPYWAIGETPIFELNNHIFYSF